MHQYHFLIKFPQAPDKISSIYSHFIAKETEAQGI